MQLRGVRQFPEGALDDDALPKVKFAGLLHLNAGVWIGAHPIYFLARQREDIDIFRIEGIVDRHHVRSAVMNAGKMADIPPCKDFPAFAFRHVSNAHGCHPRRCGTRAWSVAVCRAWPSAERLSPRCRGSCFRVLPRRVPARRQSPNPHPKARASCPRISTASRVEWWKAPAGLRGCHRLLRE